MSLAEIRLLLDVEFSARETLSKMRLLLSQLAAYQGVDGEGRKCQISLAFVFKVTHLMYAQKPRRIVDEVQSTETEVELRKSLDAVNTILSSFGIKYCCTSESDEGRGVFLSDLTTDEAVSLLGAIFSSSRLVEQIVVARLGHIEAAVKRLVTQLKGYEPQLATELDLDAIQAAPVHCVRKLNASFASMSTHKAVLLRVLHTKSLLTIIDVGCCLMGDEVFTSDFMPAVRWMQHLRVLLANRNNLSDVSGLAMIEALGAVAGETVPFVSLTELSLYENDLSRDVENAIDDVMSARCPTHPSLVAPQQGERSTYLLHCEGVSMHASFLAMSLRRFATDAEYHAFQQKADIFSGVSFASIVAVAMAASIDPEKIWACFTRLAARVFVQYDKGYYAVAATRAARSWWTKGDFYNRLELRDALVELLGAEACAMSLSHFAGHFGKHVVLFARIAGQRNDATPAVVAFRSWKPVRQTDSLLPSGPEDATVLDVLSACCSLEHFFAPAVVGGTSYVDAVTAPFDSVVVELAGASRVTCRVFSVLDTLSTSGLLVNPSIQAKIATTLRRNAEQRAVGSMRSSEWISAQSAMMLWAELFFAIAAWSLQRMQDSGRISFGCTFALRASHTLQRNAVRLDEDRLDVAVEPLADQVAAPKWH